MADARAAYGGRATHPSTAIGAWWLEERRAVPIDVYRVLIGALLAAHFAKCWQILPELIGQSGIYTPHAAGNHLGSRLFLWLDQTVGWARTCTSICVVLASGVALGILPRLCSVSLFLLSVWLYRVAFPVTSVDDNLACIVLFWLCLLPTGGALRLARTTGWDLLTELRVEGWTTSLFLVHLLLLHMNVIWWRSFSPNWYVSGAESAALCGISASLLAPSRALRLMGIAGLVGLHGYIIHRTGLTFAHGAFLVSSVLLWGDRDGTATSPRPLGVNAIVGTVVILLTVLNSVGGRARPSPWSAAVQSVLWDTALLPTASGRKLGPLPRRVVLEPDEAEGRRNEVLRERMRGAERTQLLLSYLDPPRELPSLAARVTSGLVRLRCNSAALPGETGRLWIGDGQQADPVAWYDCGARNAAPHVVLLDAH